MDFAFLDALPERSAVASPLHSRFFELLSNMSITRLVVCWLVVVVVAWPGPGSAHPPPPPPPPHPQPPPPPPAPTPTAAKVVVHGLCLLLVMKTIGGKNSNCTARGHQSPAFRLEL